MPHISRARLLGTLVRSMYSYMLSSERANRVKWKSGFVCARVSVLMCRRGRRRRFFSFVSLALRSHVCACKRAAGPRVFVC